MIDIPQFCDRCKYGRTYDLSIDDLRTQCMLTGYKSDWCDFPRRRDGTLRMGGCPLPEVSEAQLRLSTKLIKEHDLKKQLLNRALHGKTKLIRKRNISRIKQLVERRI